MTRVYGSSDDLVEIEGSKYRENEIPCYGAYVRIWFDDGSIIQVSYPKNEKAIWMICVEKKGTSTYSLEECNDENDSVYSDIYTTDARVIKHAVVSKH